MERAGIYTTGARSASFEGILGGRWRLDVRTDGGEGPIAALESWTAAGIPVAVVDDSALSGSEDEAALLGWARASTAASPRLVMVFDGTRGAEDPFLYQLVSSADVKDLVVTTVGDTLSETLPERMERPARLMDAAHWKTADKRKLKRRDGKGALPGLAARLGLLGNGAKEGDKDTKGGGRSGGDAMPREQESHVAEDAVTTRPSAAELLSAPSFGAAMRREDGEPALSSPSARAIVAVGAASRGIGCTHLACALALELAGRGVETCCAVYSPATFDAMRRALAPDAVRSDEFRFGGAAFYKWESQRAHAGEFDCVVCDCGKVDYPDDDQDSPASLFRRAGFQAMLVSGAPWLLEESSAAIAARDRDSAAAVTWFTVSAGPLVAANIAAAIARASGREGAEVSCVPYRPDLMCGDASRYGDYAALLDRVVESARSGKIDPEEFARRSGKRRQ
ncbi:MAG: hypothetical protein IJ111_00575 [Eggerthellaceae bacterium]|nr:hypothetical protein [Eggerthellaceae bacterium]